MAIFHLSVTVLKRSEGRSAVAAAAWRSGQSLFDERLGRRTKIPMAKNVVLERVLLPADAPLDLAPREALWNAVELAESRRDAQLARIIDAALPRELALAEASELALSFAHRVLLAVGFAVDLTIARSADDGPNLHAYFMIPTRPLGEAGFGPKHRPANRRAELLA